MKKMMLLVVVLGVAGAGFGWQPSETTQANAATKVDVYAIDDPKAALAALRQKWRGAVDRVSQCDMPGFTEKFRELDKAQDWCYERSVSARTYSRTSRVRAYA